MLPKNFPTHQKPPLTGFLNRDILPASRALNTCRCEIKKVERRRSTNINSTRQNRPRGVCIWSIVLADDVSADLGAASAGMEASVPLRNITLSIRTSESLESETAGALANVLRTNRSRKRLVSFAPLGLCLSGGFFYARITAFHRAVLTAPSSLNRRPIVWT